MNLPTSVKFFCEEKTGTYIVFSNVALIHKYVPGNINFHKCAVKTNKEGKISHVLKTFAPFQAYNDFF